MKKMISFVLCISLLLLSAAFIAPETAKADGETSHRYSFYYAPSDDQLADGCTYQIWMQNTAVPGHQTGQNLGSYGEMASCNGRTVYGFRSSFDFSTTSEFWVSIRKDGAEVSRVTLENVNLDNLNDKVIFPDGTYNHDLDKFTYLFCYAPSDQERYYDCDYAVSIQNDLWDYEAITTELSKPDSIRYHAFTDETKTELRRVVVGSITTNLKTTTDLQFRIKREGYQYDYSTVNFDNATLAEFDSKVVFPDKSLHKLEVLEIPDEDPNEGIAPPTGDPKKPELGPVNAADYQNGEGYIRADDPEDTEHGGEEIINLFHSTEARAYKGISYDLASNTLTLNNVSGSEITIFSDKMNCLKIKVIGSCTIGSFGFWDTYPRFEGTGTLTVNNMFELEEFEEAFRAGITPIIVGNSVKLNLNKGSGEYSGVIGVTSYEDDIDPVSVLTYNHASEKPVWKVEKTGGITDEKAYFYGVRMRTKFKAGEILKKADGSEGYYIKSISRAGTDPLYYHNVFQLVQKDGFWYEKETDESYWDKDYLFEPLTDAEIAALPSTLVDAEGTATAYLYPKYDWAKEGFVKDGKVFAMSYEGMVRNFIVNPSYPIRSFYERDEAPFMMMRVVKTFNDNGMDVTLVRCEEEFDLTNSGDQTAREALLTEKGYEAFTIKRFYPYHYSFNLTNDSITFSTQQVHTHSMTATAAKAATCTAAGNKAYYYCKGCGKYFADKAGTKTITKDSTVIPALGHNYKATTTKATLAKNGSIVTKCTRCGAVKSTVAIAYPKTFTLKTKVFVYDGKVKKPAVVVKDSKGKVVAATNYTVAYKANKYPGKATATITFKGNYTGKKVLYFTINPKPTTLATVTAAKKAFTVNWKKQAVQTSGYQIQYATNSGFTAEMKTINITKNATVSKKVTKLKAKKKYYVRIRTYKKVGTVNYYSSWSKAKYVTTKK